jgi:hypothetical protein
MAALESVFYEWEQDSILFVRAVEESADMTLVGQSNRIVTHSTIGGALSSTNR